MRERSSGAESGFSGEQSVEGRTADAKLSCGAEFVAAVELEHALDVMEDNGVEGEVVGQRRRVGDGLAEGERTGRTVGQIETGRNKTGGSEDAGGGFENGGFEDGREFSDVARPGVLEQSLERTLGECGRGLLVAATDAVDERLGDGRDVLAVFAQGWQREADGRETEGEIGQEQTLAGELAQRSMGGDHQLKFGEG
uniref:Uncharacterized protein n=1 Tax=mine drainage metagenome TaxID=410659 RepID=E6QK99_9ZZZZ